MSSVSSLTKPTLHIIGLHHTIISNEYSHCAFSGKILRFSKMMQLQNYHVIEYSNEGSESSANEHVVMFSHSLFREYYGKKDKKEFFQNYIQYGSPQHIEFENKLIIEMKKRVKFGDIICHPFGISHQRIVTEFPNNFHIETGIGYGVLGMMDNSFKIFESYAWLHYYLGEKQAKNGNNYQWVIPNYYDIDEWTPRHQVGSYIAFLGRICSDKGLNTIKAIADNSNYKIKVCGQGDITPWLHPNIEYIEPISGKERDSYLGNALCVLMPTCYIEPFGGSGVEALLCGTPLIGVDYGAFTETIIDGENGFRCHTLKDWLNAIENCSKLDRTKIAEQARAKYSLEACSVKYDKVFTDVIGLYGKGWYSL